MTSISSIQKYFNANGSVPMYALFYNGTILGIFTTFDDAATYENRRSDITGAIIQLFRCDRFNWQVVNPTWNKSKIVQDMKDLLDLSDIINANNPQHVLGKFVGSVELVFLYMMLNPEIIARYLIFQKEVEKKIKQLTNDLLKNPLYPHSQIILEEFPRFLEAIKSRKDYVKNQLPSGWEVEISYPGGFPVWKNTLTGVYANQEPVLPATSLNPLNDAPPFKREPPPPSPKKTHNYNLRSSGRGKRTF
jgi:hypothetical protein